MAVAQGTVDGDKGLELAGPRVGERLDAVDAFRLIAFAAVVLLHCLPPSANAAWPEQLADQLCRFAVPFFFIASGFFLGRSNPPTGSGLYRLFVRVAPIFLFWLVVYCVLAGLTPTQVLKPDVLARFLVTGGPAFHLWFLPALGVSLAALMLLKAAGGRAIWAVALIVHAVALLFGPYAAASGVPDLPVGMRNGPFFGLIYVVIGFSLAVAKLRLSARTALLVAAVGLCIQMAESWVLTASLAMPFDFTAGTLLFGSGMFCFALTADRLGRQVFLAHLGRLVLWMYCIHAAFLLYLPGIDIVRGYSTLALAGTVILLSALSALCAERIPLLRRLTR